MPALQQSTLTLLKALAKQRADVGAGNSGKAFITGATPEQIGLDLSRSDANETVQKTDGKAIDFAQIADEAALVAACERGLQRTSMSRIRHIAHSIGRAKAMGDQNGAILVALQNAMVRT